MRLIDADKLKEELKKPIEVDRAQELWEGWHACTIAVNEAIDRTPSAQPEIKPIEYRDCANAMLKMWMDSVVTDGEYNRIMDKLNAHWGVKHEQSNKQTGGD